MPKILVDMDNDWIAGDCGKCRLICMCSMGRKEGNPDCPLANAVKAVELTSKHDVVCHSIVAFSGCVYVVNGKPVKLWATEE